MEERIKIKFEGEVSEQYLNILADQIHETGGCLECFPRPFCGVYVDKPTCIECIKTELTNE